MSSELIAGLPTLRDDSGVTISSSIIHGVTARGGARLIISARGPSGGRYVYYVNPTLTLQYSSKLLTLTSNQRGYMNALNESLSGGSTAHPVLLFALGAAVGAVSGGAGLIFSTAVMGIDMSRRDSNVLAREGDEIWLYEAIGKVRSGRNWKAVHISSYFLYDPFRANRNSVKGWLLHESRTDVFFR